MSSVFRIGYDEIIILYIRTISRYIEQNNDELTVNGYEVLKGKRLKAFIDTANNSGKDINVPTKTTVLGVFDFRAFLNMAMLLSESEKARALRQLMLDIVIDLINRKTGGGTKYINQRDKDFVFSSLQEDNYRRQFTDALKNYVEDDRYKYAYFTDLIYVSIFREKAKEYVLSYAGKKEVSAFTMEYLKVKNSGQLTPPNPSGIHTPPLPCARRG